MDPSTSAPGGVGSPAPTGGGTTAGTALTAVLFVGTLVVVASQPVAPPRFAASPAVAPTARGPSFSSPSAPVDANCG
eukprot:11202726-Lingulodinium_polyedra.AAC.1